MKPEPKTIFQAGKKHLEAQVRRGNYLIQSNEGDPLPRYFSKKVARNLGSSLGWTEKRADASVFDTEVDAVDFAERQMAHMRVSIVKGENVG